jgi:hypothetical protein
MRKNAHAKTRKKIGRSGFSLKGIFMRKKAECVRTSSEPEREVEGLVTHFAKHLSFVFCVKFKEGRVQRKKTPHDNMFLAQI